MTKEELEHSAFRTFLRLGWQSFDSFHSGKPPEPDIIARRGTDYFGVEITSFYRQSEKRRESEEEAVVQLARTKYEANGGVNLDVSVHWSHDHVISKDQRDGLATDIVALVEANAPPVKEWVELDWSNFNDRLMGTLYSVTINRLIDYRKNQWHASRAGFVPSWDAAALQSIIDRKNPKPASYRDRYAEIWLLIVSTGHEPSSWVEMTDEVRDATYTSLFKRVFLLSSFPCQVFELRN